LRNSRASKTQGRIQAGFTLIEMIVVLVVLGLVIGIVLARGPTRSPTIDLTAASRGLTDALRHARGQAILTGRPVRISSAQASEALSRSASRNQAGQIGVALHSPPDDPRADGVLRFDPDGSANGARIVLTEGQESISITIDWLTGRITQGPIRRGDAS
jgi:general secretion pathway protein H